MAVIGSLTVKLGLVTVEWDQATAKAKQDAKHLQKSFDDLTGGLKSLGAGFAALGGSMGVGALGFAALMHKTLEFSNHIKDLADGFEVTVGQMLQFDNALKTSGANADNAAKMIGKLFGKISEAKGGNESTIAQFEKLGISFKELSTMKPDEAIKRVFDGMANSGLNAFDKARMVKEMLGKGGIGVSLDEVNEKLKKSTAEYDAHAKAIAKMGEVSDNLKTTLTNLTLAFTDMIAPFSGDGIVSVQTFHNILVALGAAATVAGVIRIATAIGTLTTAIRLLGTTSAVTLAVTSPILAAIVAAAALIAYTVSDTIETEKAQLAILETYRQSVLDKGKPSEEDAAAKAAAEAAAAAKRREINSAMAKVALAKELLVIEGHIGQLKVDALRGDEQSIKLQEIQLTKDMEIAKSRSQFNQDKVSKEFISAKERDVFAAQRDARDAAAEQKAEKATTLLKEQYKIEGQLITLKLAATDTLIGYDKDSAALKMTSLSMEKYSVDIKGVELTRVKALADIESKKTQDLLKANTNAQQRFHITEEANKQSALANQKAKEDAAYIAATRDRELESIARKGDADKLNNDFDKQRIALGIEAFNLRQNDFRMAQEILENKKRLLDIDMQIASAQATMGSGATFEAEKARLEKLKELEQDLSNERKKSIAIDEQRRTSFVIGWENAMTKFVQNSEGLGQVGSDAFNSLVSNMGNAIDNFVKTGKASFKDFAKSLIQDIMAMILKFQAMQLLMMGLKSMGVGSPSIGEPSSLLSGIAGIMGGGSGKASGGDIDRPTIVGENGPEIFIPSRRGTVIPNIQASQAMSGQPSIVYNGPYIASMSAIDTQSATQFLVQNKAAIWAANQSASRSIPTSRN